jgi:hypothetical protein
MKWFPIELYRVMPLLTENKRHVQCSPKIYCTNYLPRTTFNIFLAKICLCKFYSDTYLPYQLLKSSKNKEEHRLRRKISKETEIDDCYWCFHNLTDCMFFVFRFIKNVKELSMQIWTQDIKAVLVSWPTGQDRKSCGVLISNRETEEVLIESEFLSKVKFFYYYSL